MPSETTYGPHLPGSSSGGYAADADEGDEESGAAVHPLQSRGNDGANIFVSSLDPIHPSLSCLPPDHDRSLALNHRRPQKAAQCGRR